MAQYRIFRFLAPAVAASLLASSAAHADVGDITLGPVAVSDGANPAKAVLDQALSSPEKALLAPGGGAHVDDVSGMRGAFTVRDVDLVLPGKGGLDIALTRQYGSIEPRDGKVRSTLQGGVGNAGWSYQMGRIRDFSNPAPGYTSSSYGSGGSSSDERFTLELPNGSSEVFYLVDVETVSGGTTSTPGSGTSCATYVEDTNERLRFSYRSIHGFKATVDIQVVAHEAEEICLTGSEHVDGNFSATIASPMIITTDDGATYTMSGGSPVSDSQTASIKIVPFVATRIQDRFGNAISMSYVSSYSTGTVTYVDTGSIPQTKSTLETVEQLATITDSYGRVVRFVYDATTGVNLLTAVELDVGGVTRPVRSFQYTTLGVDGDDHTIYGLSAVDDADGNTLWTYDYWSEADGKSQSNGLYALSHVVYPTGGDVMIEYASVAGLPSSHESSGKSDGVAVSRVTRTNTSGGTPSVWSYFYSYPSATSFRVGVITPENRNNFETFAWSNHPTNSGSGTADYLWGYPVQRVVSTALETETIDFAWTPNTTINAQYGGSQFYKNSQVTTTRARGSLSYQTKQQDFDDQNHPRTIRKYEGSVEKQKRLITYQYNAAINHVAGAVAAETTYLNGSTTAGTTRSFTYPSTVGASGKSFLSLMLPQSMLVNGLVTTNYDYHPTGDVAMKRPFVRDSAQPEESFPLDPWEPGVEKHIYERGVVSGVLTNIIDVKRTVDAFGHVVRVVDGRGHAANLSYDASERLVGVSFPDSPELDTQIDYSITNGTVLRLMDGRQMREKTWLDGFGRVKEMRDTQTNDAVFSYDLMGRLITKTVTNKAWVTGFTLHVGDTTRFDVLGRTTMIDHPNTNLDIVYTYDDANKKVTLVNENGAAWVNSFASLGDPSELRLTRTDDPAGQYTSYVYDDVDAAVTTRFGLLSQVYQGKSGQAAAASSYRKFYYDNQGRMSRVWGVDTGDVYFTYNTFTRATRRDARNHTLNFRTDPLGRQNEISMGSTVFFSVPSDGFDGAGNVVKATSHTGQLFQYTFDAANRLVGETFTQDGVTYDTGFVYTYGKLSGIRYPSGRVVHYDYDQYPALSPNWGRVAGVFDDQIAWAQGIGYQSSGSGNPSTMGIGALQKTYSEDSRQRLSRVQVPGIFDLSFSYDAAGQMTALTDGLDATRSMSIDHFTHGPISLAVRGDGRRVAYTYDVQGNRLTSKVTQSGVMKTYTSNYASDNRLHSVSDPQGNVDQYNYDVAGNMTSFQRAGQAAKGTVFDDMNRMREVRSASGSLLAEYVYDPFGRRVAKRDSSGTKAVYHHGPSGQLIGETAANGAPRTEYVQGPFGTLAVVEYDANGVYANHHYNHGNTVGSTYVQTDKDGLVSYRADAFPFGDQKVVRQGDLAGTQSFAGREEDDETGFSYFGARFYDPNTGRFVSTDPLLRPAGAYLNRYVYCQNRPFEMVDPNGMMAVYVDGMYSGDIDIPMSEVLSIAAMQDLERLNTLRAIFAGWLGERHSVGTSVADPNWIADLPATSVSQGDFAVEPEPSHDSSDECGGGDKLTPAQRQALHERYERAMRVQQACEKHVDQAEKGYRSLAANPDTDKVFGYLNVAAGTMIAWIALRVPRVGIALGGAMGALAVEPVSQRAAARAEYVHENRARLVNECIEQTLQNMQ